MPKCCKSQQTHFSVKPADPEILILNTQTLPLSHPDTCCKQLRLHLIKTSALTQEALQLRSQTENYQRVQPLFFFSLLVTVALMVAVRKRKERAERDLNGVLRLIVLSPPSFQVAFPALDRVPEDGRVVNSTQQLELVDVRCVIVPTGQIGRCAQNKVAKIIDGA